jgi:hypothetical protein
MLPYRIKLLSADGVVQEQWTIDYPNDDEAIDEAGRISHPHKIQVFQQRRLVAEFPPQQGLFR